jgi:hypothetical protein
VLARIRVRSSPVPLEQLRHRELEWMQHQPEEKRHDKHGFKLERGRYVYRQALRAGKPVSSLRVLLADTEVFSATVTRAFAA